LSQQVGVPCSRMAVWRTLRKLRISRKRCSTRTNSRSLKSSRSGSTSRKN
jgi:hypothetical protein